MNDERHARDFKLTGFSHCAGCAAKLDSLTLAKLVEELPPEVDGRVLVGLETGDDAGVFLLRDDLAIVQTLDFFPPIVDDPYAFGQIAAANALSDVYAMGGKPVTALNIMAFPPERIPQDVITAILRGGFDKVREAGAFIMGGHTIKDETLKYGLAVTGAINPSNIFTNKGARAGDALILTKKLGTGLITSGARADAVSEATLKEVIDSMSTLNKAASETMVKFQPNACTDVTGFSLIGHACIMARASNVGVILRWRSVPIFDEAVTMAEMGLMPEGSHANRHAFERFVEVRDAVPEGVMDVLYDAQTSGGLLISVPADRADALLSALHAAGVASAALVGEITADHPRRIEISR